jgi:hypothetical protein
MYSSPDEDKDDSKAFQGCLHMTPKQYQPVPDTICDNALEVGSCALSETTD